MSFLRGLFEQGGLTALENAPISHPQLWKTVNNMDFVPIASYALDTGATALCCWALGHMSSPLRLRPSLLTEAIVHNNTTVVELLLVQLEAVYQEKDHALAKRVGMAAARTAAEHAHIKIVDKIADVLRATLLCNDMEEICVIGVPHADFVRHFWSALSTVGRVEVGFAAAVQNAQQTLAFVVDNTSVAEHAQIEDRLSVDSSAVWCAALARRQREILCAQTGTALAPTVPRKI